MSFRPIFPRAAGRAPSLDEDELSTRRSKPVARFVREGSTSQAVSQANWMQRFRGLHISESVSEPSAVERVRELRDV